MAVYIAVLCDFVTDNAFQELLGPIAAVYIASLAIYTGDKEFDRWSHYHEKKRPGEVFVVIWTIILIVIFALDIIFMKPYRMPGELISTYIAVLTVLAITQKSKDLYLKKR
jgi:hypothetical protein